MVRSAQVLSRTTTKLDKIKVEKKNMNKVKSGRLKEIIIHKNILDVPFKVTTFGY